MQASVGLRAPAGIEQSQLWISARVSGGLQSSVLPMREWLLTR
jgi:hypothetical protein